MNNPIPLILNNIKYHHSTIPNMICVNPLLGVHYYVNIG